MAKKGKTMNRETVFIHIKDLEQGLPQNSSALFGSSEVAYSGGLDPIKAVRKMRESVFKLAPVFSPQTVVTEDSLLHTRTDKTGASYVDPIFVRVNNEGTSHYITTRLLVTDSKGELQEGSKLSLDALVGSERLQVVTGVCLFSTSGVSGITEDGNSHLFADPDFISGVNSPIREIQVDPWVHPYELDTILRTTNFISGMLSHQKVDISFHVPRLEYYLYGILLHSRGLMSYGLLQNWFDRVDGRAQRVERLFRKRLPNLCVSIASPLGSAEDYLRNSEGYSLTEMVEQLSEADQLWEVLLEGNPPGDFDDLGFLSYTYPYLEKAKRGGFVAVENPDEERIFRETKKNIGILQGQPTTIAGIYVHPKVLVTNGHKRFLYSHTPEVGQRVQGLREIVGANR